MRERIDELRNNIAEDEAIFISSYPNIFYYSLFTSEDAYLLITHDKAVILTDSRYFLQAKEQCPNFEIFDITKGLSGLLNDIPQNKIIYEEKNLTVARYINLKKNCKDKVFLPGSDKISLARQIKSEEEIRKIRAAEDLGSAAFEYILGIIKEGMMEIEIASEIEYFMRKNGASSLSFETIAASGKRSALPHGVASKKEIESGDLLTLDFGCVLDGYCSDMTRTVGIGYLTDTQKEIYSVVLKAQTEALSKMQVGDKCSSVDKIARDVIENAGYGKNFGHSLGHSVGIEIHEAPNFSPKSEDFLKDGNVITVEPGIYIDGLGGVRIEDVIAAENGKIVNLTKSPKELIIL